MGASASAPTTTPLSAIPRLVGLLRDGSPAAKEQAAGTLMQLAEDDDSKATIARAGAIPLLVDLLRNGTPVAKERAAGALKNLSLDDENEAAIAQAGAIPPLTELLQSGRPQTKENAAGALSYLAVGSSGTAIAQAGAIPLLVQLLRQGTPAAQVYATTALVTLTAREETRGIVASSGAIPQLVEVLHQGSTGAQEFAAIALSNLAVDEGNEGTIARAGAIRPLVALLWNGSPVGKEKAAGALMNLSGSLENMENQVAIAQEAGAIQGLVELLQNGTPVGKEKATAVLRNLAIADENEAAIKRAGAIPLLEELLQQGTPTAKVHAQQALKNLGGGLRSLNAEAVCCARGHLLKYLGLTPDIRWMCDGCKSGITDSRQTSGMARWRCEACDYDLCPKCISAAGAVKGAPLFSQQSSQEPWVQLDLPDLQSIDNEAWRRIPEYWDKPVSDEPSLFKMGSSLEAKVMERLLESTFVPVKTSDREGNLPIGYRFLRCTRIENHTLWNRYMAARWAMKQQLQFPATPVAKMSQGGPPLTQQALLDKKVQQLIGSSAARKFAERLKPCEWVNEVYLFHGTSEKGAEGIATNGFDLGRVGSGKGTMFGPGFYFAESSTKSEEYAAEAKGISAGTRRLLLCRVALGRVHHQLDGGEDFFDVMQAALKGKKPCHAVLGDRKAVVNTFREFIIYNPCQVYPEYIIEFTREVGQPPDEDEEEETKGVDALDDFFGGAEKAAAAASPRKSALRLKDVLKDSEEDEALYALLTNKVAGGGAEAQRPQGSSNNQAEVGGSYVPSLLAGTPRGARPSIRR